MKELLIILAVMTPKNIPVTIKLGELAPSHSQKPGIIPYSYFYKHSPVINVAAFRKRVLKH